MRVEPEPNLNCPTKFVFSKKLCAAILLCFYLVAAPITASAAGAEKAAQSYKMTRDARKLMQDGEADQAISLLQRAQRMDPSQIEPYVKLADAYFLVEKFQQSLNECNIALKMKPDTGRRVDLLYRRGCAYGGLKKLPEAFRDLDEALKLNPKRFRTYFAKAEIYRRAGKYSDAVANLEKYTTLVATDPSHASRFSPASSAHFDIPSAHLSCAECYRALGDRKNERKHLSAVVTMNPDSIEAVRLRADSFFKDQMYKDAAKDFATVVKLEPENEHCQAMLKTALAKAQAN